MAKRSVSVLLAQLQPRSNDLPSNLAVALALIEEHPGVELAVFPELFLNGYSLTGISPTALGDPSSPLATLQSCARRNATAVVVGLAEATADGIADTAMCIDENGAIAGCYRKVHLFGQEHSYFRAGDRYLVATLAGVKVAPIICYDVEFPEPARAVATAGAELLVTIAANMDPYADEHSLCLRVRAMENRVPHVYVNRVGEESGFVFCGASGVADASGRIVAMLAPYAPAIRVVEVSVGEQPQPDYLAELRPGLPVVRGTEITLEAAS
jgi:predicted amidohydrolase